VFDFKTIIKYNTTRKHYIIGALKLNYNIACIHTIRFKTKLFDKYSSTRALRR